MRALAILLLTAVATSPAMASDQVAGPAHVVDGDTVDVAGVRIRLDGIDAFETKQGRAGRISTETLRRLAVGEIQCVLSGVDRYRRRLGRCFASAVDLNAEMVRNGQALAYWPIRGRRLERLPCPHPTLPECHRTTPELLALEDDARRHRRGIWRLRYLPRNPWCVRHPDQPCVSAQ